MSCGALEFWKRGDDPNVEIKAAIGAVFAEYSQRHPNRGRRRPAKDGRAYVIGVSCL